MIISFFSVFELAFDLKIAKTHGVKLLASVSQLIE